MPRASRRSAPKPTPPPTDLLGLLQRQLAAELLSTLQGRQHHARAQHLAAHPLGAVFLAHANESLARADLLAARITELEAEPNFDPLTLADRAQAPYRAAATPIEQLLADRAALEASMSDLRGALPALEGAAATQALFDALLVSQLLEAQELTALLAVWETPSAAPAPTPEPTPPAQGHVPGGRIH